jgi:ribonuclease HII
MQYVIGCDEAGYGPNLGPLVISATAWQLPADADGDCDLYELLAEAISPKLERRSADRPRRLAIADSKQLYQSRGDYRLLEEAVHVALGSLERKVSSWRELSAVMAPECELDFNNELWHAGYEADLPLHAEQSEIEALLERFDRCQQDTAIKLLDMRSDCVYPPRFNRLCHELGSKGLLLSTCTLKLVADMIAKLPPGNVTVLADKHGGRNRYAPLLQEAFDDHWVEIRQESRAESAYRIRTNDRTIDCYFRVGGEAALPTAWASLCSKYQRELAMDALNRYWQARVPNLQPTAGYPVYAKRFMVDIAGALAEEGIAEELIWRLK